MTKLHFLVSTAVSMALGLLSARNASAAMEWADLPGCAREFAVGAADAPWATGCDANGTIFYLTQTRSCANGICLSVPQWKQPPAKGGATFIAVDLRWSNIFITDRNGALWAGLVRAGERPVGGASITRWEKQSTKVAGGGAACVTSFALETGTSDLGDFWGIGCGSAIERGIWQLQPVWNRFIESGLPLILPGSEYWSPVGLDEANAAHQITLFSTSTTSSITQNPWAVAAGLVWAYNGSNFDYVPTPADGLVTYATDGHIVADGSVYKWSGSIYGHGGSWTKVVGPTPRAPIRQIAFAGKATSIGPSRLYAVDRDGRIYVAYDALVGNPK